MVEFVDTLTPQLVVLFLGLVVACWTDLRTGKIRNALTLPMVALGIAMNLSLGTGATGAWGLLAAIAIYYPLWIVRVQKGGDAKLWMGIGALMGPWFVFEASLWYAVIYLPIGLLILVIRGKLWNLVDAMMWTYAKAQGQDVGEAPEGTELRTAPVIAAAVLIALFTELISFVPDAS